MGMVRFDEIAKECRNNFKGSFANVPIVGLEHIEPYDMLLHNSDINVETTFTKSFRKGQILFGRRRAYQHKACVATFEGVCSGDITVIEPIEGKVHPDLLPFIVQNDDFFEHAIKGSNGALSPRVKWEHMANFEVYLPSLAEQKVLAEKLWAAYEVKQSYLKMIEATQEMVKSQFIEMFGQSPLINDMNECFSVIRNGASIKQGQIEGGIPITRIETISEEFVDRAKMGYAGIIDDKYKSYYLQNNDILISHINSLKHIGKCALYSQKGNEIIIHGMNLLCLRPKCEIVNPVFAIHMLRSNIIKNEIANITKPAVNQASFSVKDFGKIKAIIPNMDEQEKFVQIAEQADKSGFELRKSIDAIDKVIKSLINENL